MIAVLDVGGALLLGVAASGHCLVMCGGITTALGVATGTNAAGRPRALLLALYQIGRITSYAAAGVLLSTAVEGFVALLDVESVRVALRIGASLTFLIAALVVFGCLRDPGFRLGRIIWPKLAPLGRRLLPVTTPRRAFAFGMIWGWMPCGLVYTVLLMAAAQGDAAKSAAIMLAFGIGTAPVMLAASAGARHLALHAHHGFAKGAAGGVLLLSALATLAGPWLVDAAPALHAWLPFDCVSVR